MAALIQQNSNSVSTGTTCAIALGAAVTGGSTIVVCTTGGTSVTCTDSKSNVYVNAGGFNGVFYTINAAAGTTTFTITSTGAVTFMEIIVAEFTRESAGGGLDQFNRSTGTSAAPATSLTTTANGDLVFGYLDGNTAMVKGSTYTLVTNATGDVAEYLVQTTAGTQTVNFTQTSGGWAVFGLSFKVAPLHNLLLCGVGR